MQKRHRTRIIQTSQTGPTLFMFNCKDCKPEDYDRRAHTDRSLAVQDARAHRDAFREQDGR